MKKYTYHYKKLWTIVTVSIFSPNWNSLDNIAKDINTKIDYFELKFSRFIKRSFLSILNRERRFQVDSQFVDLLNKSIEMYSFTNGYFNPLVDVRRIWYEQEFEDNKFEIKDYWERNINLEEIDIDWEIVSLKEWMYLDFWAIGKWYLTDCLTEYLLSKWIKDFFVNAGWDISIRWTNSWEDWKIWIQNPIIKDKYIKVWLKDCSISTSWSLIRTWEIWDDNYHHLVSPIDFKNKNDIASVTVIWKYWYFTDSIATAIFNMWIDLWVGFMDENNVSWLIVWSDWQVKKSKLLKLEFA